jgi:hypothetical protein
MFQFLLEILITGPIERFWTHVVPKNRLDDPVYEENVRKLIERNKRFEEGKE